MTAIDTQTLAAWATVAAVVVALGISVVPVVWRWWTRPALTITFGSERPLLTLEPSDTSPVSQVVRARVTNGGRRGTTNVRAQITRVWLRPEPITTPSGQEWSLLIDMPIWLTWVSRKHDSTMDAERIDLARGMIDYIAVSEKSQSDGLDYGGHWILERGAQCQDENLSVQLLTVGEFRIEVTVFSDDSWPVTSVVSYRQTAINRQFVELTQSTAPSMPPPRPPGDLKDVFKGSQPE